MKRSAAPPRGVRQTGSGAADFSDTWLEGRLRHLIGKLRGARLCVAYSGGADSAALLAALAALRTRCGFTLRALHINHQLQPGADAMAAAALRSARQLRVRCALLPQPVRPARGESVEAAARAVRSAALQRERRAGEWLLLAQHLDDQLETVLLQLLRGAGVAGLAAMPEVAGCMLRPLLGVRRASLQAYLRQRGLPWHDDPSNDDERFDRNYLRRRVAPLLAARWPAAAVTVARSAGLAAEAQGLLETLADQSLGNAVDGSALQVAVLRRLAPAACRNALRRWLALRDLPLPDQRRLQEIAGPMLRARHDSQPQVAWPGAVVRRHGDLLYALPAAPAAGPKPAVLAGAGAPRRWDWRLRPRLLLPEGGQLELRLDASGPLNLSALPDLFEIRFRLGGEKLAARHGRQTLKRLLQERHLPPWLRSSVPLLYAGERLVAVADWWHEPALQGSTGNTPVVAGAARGRLVWQAPLGLAQI
ncbi:MAG: tRNA lysidine(34) synthetase TilS [Steroidobacteraceae bacterium]